MKLITLREYAALHPEWSERELCDRVSHYPDFPQPHPLKRKPRMYWEHELDCYFGYVKEAA